MKNKNQEKSVLLLDETLFEELSGLVARNGQDSSVTLKEIANKNTTNEAQKKVNKPKDNTKLEQLTIKTLPQSVQILKCDNMRFHECLTQNSKNDMVHIICEKRCDYVLLTEKEIYFLDLKSLKISNEVKKKFLGTRALIRVLHEINSNFTNKTINLNNYYKLYYIVFTTNEPKIKFPSPNYIYQPASNFYESKLTNYGVIQINNNATIKFEDLKKAILSQKFNEKKTSKL
jgi:hypothetical protein